MKNFELRNQVKDIEKQLNTAHGQKASDLESHGQQLEKEIYKKEEEEKIKAEEARVKKEEEMRLEEQRRREWEESVRRKDKELQIKNLKEQIRRIEKQLNTAHGQKAKDLEAKGAELESLIHQIENEGKEENKKDEQVIEEVAIDQPVEQNFEPAPHIPVEETPAAPLEQAELESANLPEEVVNQDQSGGRKWFNKLFRFGGRRKEDL